jgi:hypothetical protein
MPQSTKDFPLDAVRTDGWFERIGEGIGSFQALCEIVGERFFAFSIIVGARITALTVDRRNPDLSLVDFVVGLGESENDLEPQRLTLADFRRRLVGALLVEDDKPAPAPVRETEIEVIQFFIGVRYLLLSPLYGYSLRRLVIDDDGPRLVVLHDGLEEQHDLDTFRFRIRALVREELERVAAGSRSAIDLSKVTEAEAAAMREEWTKVVSLLGSWPAPLAIFLRTPEGRCSRRTHARSSPKASACSARRACTWAKWSKPKRSSASASSTRKKGSPRRTSSVAWAKRSCRTIAQAKPSGLCAARSRTAAHRGT